MSMWLIVAIGAVAVWFLFLRKKGPGKGLAGL